MDLTAWRALFGAQSTLCRRSDADTQVCQAPPTALGGGFLARDLTFTFEQDRLTQIAFQTSVNGFDNATAVLRRAFGDPAEVVRDDVRLKDGLVFPHVLMVWKSGRSTVRLSDPLPAGDRLSVRFDLAPRRAPPAARVRASTG
jgi:hypothetical protein